MTAIPPDDPSLFDQLVTQTDNGPEEQTPDPPQDAGWRPPQEILEVGD